LRSGSDWKQQQRGQSVDVGVRLYDADKRGLPAKE
jgi:hypothetical protein